MARQTIVSTQQAERITDRALRHIRPIFGKCYGYPAYTASVSDDHGWLRVILKDSEGGSVTLRLPPTSVVAVVLQP